MDGTAAGVGLGKDNERRKMKKNKCMYLCACLLLCGTAASAESLGSSNDDIQKNFNRLVATKQCPGCNLRGAVLTRMDLREADLQGADLSDAKLSLTNLSKANLRNAVLRGAALAGADFAGTDLRGVDLTEVQLAGAYLKEALLDQEITPEKPYEPEELPQALPEEADLPETSTPVLPLPPAQELITPEQEAVAPAAKEEEVLPPTVPAADTSAGTEESSAVFDPPELSDPPVKTVQESREKKKEAVRLPELPDIERRTATTVRPKELTSIAEVQIGDPGQADNLPDTLPDTAKAERTKAEGKTAGLDDIPVIYTTPEEEKVEIENKGSELSLWDTFTSLFGSDTEEKEETAKAVVEQVKKDVQPATQQRVSVPVSAAGRESEPEQEVLVTPALKRPQSESNQERAEAEQQVGAYNVETFGQSRAKLQTLVDKLHEEKRCVSCNLAGADLAGQDLEEVDLERADLSGAQLERTDLRTANLKGVNFTDANLKNADLRGADLYLADFTNADLTGAQLQGALIDSTTFTGAIGAKVEAAHE